MVDICEGQSRQCLAAIRSFAIFCATSVYCKCGELHSFTFQCCFFKYDKTVLVCALECVLFSLVNLNIFNPFDHGFYVMCYVVSFLSPEHFSMLKVRMRSAC